MTFQPIVPFSGYGGWKFLQRTMESQKKALFSSPEISRKIDYFKENIGKVQSASVLTSDRRLSEVTLGAYGLDSDINNKYFITKILESDLSDRRSLANKLSDKRYQSMAQALNLDPTKIANTYKGGFVKETIQRYQDKQFELAVGNVNNDFRLALNLKQSLKDSTEGTSSDTAHWYKVLGTPPLRKVFETALNLPSSIGTLDIDYQVKQFKSRAKAVFGTDKLPDFNEGELQEKLTATFLTRAEVRRFSATNSSAQNALNLLSQIQIPRVSLY